jgi:small subunit ribosomal protein S8
MNTDTLADMLTRIRNAALARHPAVSVPASRTKERVLELLIEEGYIASFSHEQDFAGKPVLKIFLRYDRHGGPVIREVRRVSRPGRRVYVKKNNIPRQRGGLGVYIISTSRGMLSDAGARKAGLGGELICSVF